jgi:hypothetical protein
MFIVLLSYITVTLETHCLAGLHCLDFVCFAPLLFFCPASSFAAKQIKSREAAGREKMKLAGM